MPTPLPMRGSFGNTRRLAGGTRRLERGFGGGRPQERPQSLRCGDSSSIL